MSAKIIEKIIEREQERCFRCGAHVRGLPFGYSVHHRVLGNRKDNRPCNLILLCGSGTTGCHGDVHHHRADATAGGWIVSKYADPANRPVKHWQHGMVLLNSDYTYTPWTGDSDGDS